ncbi:hypothetical protein DVH24_036654 [Malus domestica]|uniref:Uncharacterized protein n=1 Tax=Malus domestica TaxID=3750 RepID=A0A498IM75_MALDO|nr:hypothetical protein DVH24_036654 [Malus domestica]
MVVWEVESGLNVVGKSRSLETWLKSMKANRFEATRPICNFVDQVLHDVAVMNQVDLFEILYKTLDGINVNLVDKEGRTPIRMAIEDQARCPGIGERKVKRLYDTFHEPFKRVVASHPAAPETSPPSNAEPRSVDEDEAAVET